MVEGVTVYWERSFEKWALGALSKIQHFAEAENLSLTGNILESRLVRKPRGNWE